MSDDFIAAQIAQVTATSEDGEHLIQLEQIDVILTDRQGRLATAREASAFLHVGEWGTSHPCATDPDCVLWSHVSDLPAKVTAPTVTEEELDTLVRKASRPTLASLYKKARSTGLVSPQPQGYF